jgi:hypothetical protein
VTKVTWGHLASVVRLITSEYGPRGGSWAGRYRSPRQGSPDSYPGRAAQLTAGAAGWS